MNDRISFARKLRRNQTEVEKLMWKYLRDRRFDGVKFRRQHPIGPYIVDFISLEMHLIIELDGGGHNTDIGKKKDKERRVWLEKNGYKVLRFWNNELMSNMDDVLSVIHNVLTVPHHNPLPRERKIRRHIL